MSPPVGTCPAARISCYVTGEQPSDGRYEWFARQFGLQLQGSL